MNANSIPKVENMVSSSGGKVANQFMISTDDGKFFKSYDSNIAFIGKDGSVILDEKYWNYSNTTTKYLSQFLGGEKKASIRKNIDAGIYKLENLN